ncbi:MAG TPA: response regulator [Anaerolineaceae bacterium]
MESKPWQILLVEDDEDDYLLTRQMLKEARGSSIGLQWVSSIAKALAALEIQLPDVVLVDYFLGSENGLDLIRLAVARGFTPPFILLTGRGNYDVDLEAMQIGAVDYLSKNEATPTLLERVIRYAIDRHRRTEELKQVLDQLETEQARLNAVFENAPTGIMLVDSDAVILYANPAAEQILQHPIPYHQPCERHVNLGICYPDGTPYQACDLPLTHSAQAGESFSNVELIVIWPEGQRRSLLFNSTPVRNHQGQVTGAIGVFTDLTERKKAEEEIRRNLAQIELQRHLMQSREKERLHIARELHDGPLQGLIAMAWYLKDLRNSLDDPALVERIERVEGTLQAQIRELRSFSQQLRPPVLTPFGLEKAIRSHAEQFQANHPELQIYLGLQPDYRLLSEDVRLVLYRIYQELLNNIVRHAGASVVEVRLEIEPKQVWLQISDNGKGFVVPESWVENAREGHLGLVGVQERANSVNGTVEIISEPNSGSIVRVSVPLADSAQAIEPRLG